MNNGISNINLTSNSTSYTSQRQIATEKNTQMSSSFMPDEENDYIPQNIFLTGGAGKSTASNLPICDDCISQLNTN